MVQIAGWRGLLEGTPPRALEHLAIERRIGIRRERQQLRGRGSGAALAGLLRHLGRDGAHATKTD